VEVGVRQKANGKTVTRQAGILSSLICPNIVLMHCGHGLPKWRNCRDVQKGECFVGLGYHHQFESVHYTVHPYYECPRGCTSHNPDPDFENDWFADVEIVSSAIKELFNSTNFSIELPANWYLAIDKCTCSLLSDTGVTLCTRNVMEEHKIAKSKLRKISSHFTRLEKSYGKIPLVRSSSISSSTAISATKH